MVTIPSSDCLPVSALVNVVARPNLSSFVRTRAFVLRLSRDAGGLLRQCFCRSRDSELIQVAILLRLLPPYARRCRNSPTLIVLRWVSWCILCIWSRQVWHINCLSDHSRLTILLLDVGLLLFSNGFFLLGCFRYFYL